MHGLWRQADRTQSLFFDHVTLNELYTLSEPLPFPQKSVCVCQHPYLVGLPGRINEIAKYLAHSENLINFRLYVAFYSLDQQF